MVNALNYRYKNNCLCQCVHIINYEIDMINNNEVNNIYITFRQIRRLCLQRFKMDIFNLSNAFVTYQALSYFGKLMLKDKTFKTLHSDVIKYHRLKRYEKEHSAVVWIITNHNINAMSKTDILTVLDSVIIQLKSEWLSIHRELLNRKDDIYE